MRWHVVADPATLAREVAALILMQADAAIAECGEFRIALAGGSTPEAVYRLLGDASAHWSGWRIFFGDERCLPPQDPARNSVMAARIWLDRVPIPPANIHAIPAELGPERAAEQIDARIVAQQMNLTEDIPYEYLSTVSFAAFAISSLSHSPR